MDENTLLGSPFEMSLRILIILDEITHAELDQQQICSIDFIAVYAADFDLLDENLHGYGNYRFSEFPARSSLVLKALKALVLERNVVFTSSRQGFTYKISDAGRKISHMFTSPYAGEYRLAVKITSQHYDMLNSNDMLRDIHQCTLRSLQEGANESILY